MTRSRTCGTSATLTATSTLASPTHTYVADGTYTVTLTLTDTWGKTASTTRVVTIAKPVTNVAPVPVINPVVCAARACTLYGISSSDANSDTFTYLWNFGDGTADQHGGVARAHVRRRWHLHGDPHHHRRVG